MKNYVKIVLAYIKKYKSRSFAMILSMVLSIGLIVGVGSLSKSAKQADIDKLKYETGTSHVRYKDVDNKQLEEIQKNKDKNIEQIGVSSYYDSTNPNSDMMINLIKADKGYIKIGNSEVIAGKFPTNSNEIALESWVLKNMGLSNKIGQKITLDLFSEGKKEYTLTGILKDRPREKADLTMEAFLCLNPSNESKHDVYVKFNEKSNINKSIDSIAKLANIKSKNIGKNTMLLEEIGQSGKIDYKVTAIAGIAAIISTVVVYGIFSISILQRTSEYGVIRAIGADSFKVFKLIFLELLILSVISIPIGILLGLTGSKIFSSVSGGLFTEATVKISKILVPFDVILFSILIIGLMILLISILMYRSIKKISPMDAIKNNIDSKGLKNSRFLSVKNLIKFISFTKILALKNMFRSKKRLCVIILSMSLGGSLFIVSSFYGHLAKIQGEKVAETSGTNTDYRLDMNPAVPMNYGISSTDVQKIENLDGVDSVKKIQVLYSRMILDKSKVSEPDYFEQKNSTPYNKNVLNGLLVQKENSNDVIIKHNIYGYDEKLLKGLEKYLKNGEIDLNKMKNEPIALINIPHPIGPNVLNLKVGDKVKVTFRVDGNSSNGYFKMEDKGGKYITKEFVIGGIIDSLIDSSDYYTGPDGPDLVISDNQFKQISGIDKYKILNIDKKKSANDTKVYNQIFDITKHTQGSILTDLIQEREDIGILQQNKIIFIYSIIVILFIISLFNIINNVSYSLISRTNEFGMIRAIGLSNIEFNKMIKFEGLMYGIISSILACVFGIIGQLVLYKVISPNLISPKFIIQWKIYILIIFINIAIGCISTYIPLRKIKSLSIVESIRSLD
ncbi:ABC transporter permease [[Clostridium] sordellii]|uniref:ABC transporter permease n=1 Tax=Paraclostridium sordellii TaxID=1505 RepID=UPI0005DBED0D|nr:ABC transporter permease [Paeniclostridium sordellii]CEN23308.1 ABC transporter permease [[Clostridium] sordellii] [Paeniclostridium sordellii]